MSVSPDPSLRALTGCGCCEGVAVTTPVRIHNRPGLSAVAYRVGTHARFKQSLLARLSSAKYPALGGLTTREDDDFSIGLLDAWSAVADVLTFYQERIANEAFLRTATERFSVLEMARLIGYRLDPGVAASVHLAFEIESAPGAFGQALATGNQVQAPPQTPPDVTIEAGVKVQSIPGPDEDPQVFETVESIQARVEQNAIKPRLIRPQPVSTASEQVLLRGTTLNLNPGDLVLIKQDDSAVVKPVVKVTLDDTTDSTHLLFDDPPAEFPPFQRATGSPQTIDGFLSQFASSAGERAVPLSADVIGSVVQGRWKVTDLNALIDLQNWDRDQAIRMLREATKRSDLSSEIYTFRQRTKVFGYNAPKKVTYTGAGPPETPDKWGEWDPETLGSSPPSGDPEDSNKLFLAESNEQIVPGSYIAIQKGSAAPEVYQVTAVRVRPRTAYGISAETTDLTLDQSWWDPVTDGFSVIRTATVYAESKALEPAPLPITDTIQQETASSEALDGENVEESQLPTAVVLDQAYLGLTVGQTVVLTGVRTDLEGVTDSEILTIEQVWIEEGFSVLEFNQNLKGRYQRDTVALMANVALATHGETVEEILGNGTASQSFQRFILKQPPLTYVGGTTPSGSQSTLEVRVNDLLWKEEPTFYGRGPEERIYVTQLDDDGDTAVIFGDGIQGARLPTGQANVKAKYRKGIGLGGLVQAGQLAQLMTRPLGVKSAVNPMSAEGAEDANTLDHARRNAPTTVLTLDRIVSLQDYEDFARSYAGIDKALATWAWTGESRGVFLTVAGPNGAEISEGGKTHTTLMETIAAQGDPNVLLVIRSFRQRLFRVTGTVTLKADRLVEAVQPEIEKKLRRRFSFNERQFGQPIPLSEVIAVIHEVDAVKWVDIDLLHRSDEPPDRHAVLSADFPRPGATELLPAELLILDPAPLDLEVRL